MVQLIKKGGLRERANRSKSYKGSENTEASLKPNRYRQDELKEQNTLLTPRESEPSCTNKDQNI